MIREGRRDAIDQQDRAANQKVSPVSPGAHEGSDSHTRVHHFGFSLMTDPHCQKPPPASLCGFVEARGASLSRLTRISQIVSELRTSRADSEILANLGGLIKRNRVQTKGMFGQIKGGRFDWRADPVWSQDPAEPEYRPEFALNHRSNSPQAAFRPNCPRRFAATSRSDLG